MKKTIIGIIIAFVSFSAMAQETGDSILRSKKGIPVLPSKGDWAIGADASPYLSYLGNIFNNTQNNTLNLGSQTLYGRYFIANNAAIRFAFQINKTSSFERYYVQDDAEFLKNPLSKAQVEDVSKDISNSYNLNIGYQKFRGYGRLKGFYGIFAGYGLSVSKVEYTYGNTITSLNTVPSASWGYNADNSRVLTTDNGISQTISAGLIGGVEYYFMPKVCVGFEVMLSANYSWNSQGDSSFERWDGSKVEKITRADSPNGPSGNSIFTHSPGNFSTGLYLMFHF